MRPQPSGDSTLVSVLKGLQGELLAFLDHAQPQLPRLGVCPARNRLPSSGWRDPAGIAVVAGLRRAELQCFDLLATLGDLARRDQNIVDVPSCLSEMALQLADAFIEAGNVLHQAHDLA